MRNVMDKIPDLKKKTWQQKVTGYFTSTRFLTLHIGLIGALIGLLGLTVFHPYHSQPDDFSITSNLKGLILVFTGLALINVTNIVMLVRREAARPGRPGIRGVRVIFIGIIGLIGWGFFQIWCLWEILELLDVL